MKDKDFLILIALGIVGLFVLDGFGAQSNAAFMPGFNKNVRTMCDNSGCYPIN
jgi:hypothetical protein